MLIFLAGGAFLLMLLALGDRAAARLWQGGASRYFDYCDSCDARYARPAGVRRLICPHGHLMSAVIVAASTGVANGYLGRVLSAYALAMPVAFVCVLCVRPVVQRLTAATVQA